MTEQCAERDHLFREINAILRYLHHKPVDFAGAEDPFGYLSSCYGIEARRVELTGAWYRDAIGPYLARLTDGSMVALIPTMRSFKYKDPHTGKWVAVTAKTASRVSSWALCLYLPFPPRKMSLGDLFVFMAKTISPGDVLRICVASLVVVFVGMITPNVTKLIFSGIIPAGADELMGAIAVLLVGAALGAGLMNIISRLALEIISARTSFAMQAAAMNRVMDMPAPFFRQHSAGDISSRLSLVRRLSKATVKAVFSSGLTGLLSLIYIVQVVTFAPALVVPAVTVVLLQIAISSVAAAWYSVRNRIQMEAENGMSGFMLSLLEGMQKVRLAGAEAFMKDRWAKNYAEVCDARYGAPKFLLWYPALNTFIASLGTVVFYAIAANGDVSYPDFMAFISAYGMLAAGLSSLLGVVEGISQFRPMLQMLEPLLETVPELQEGKVVPERLSGAIELHHVSFAYDESAEPVVDDVTLSIKAGQHVGICGQSGCGKSTLMRLMLGLETPTSGAICYDGYDLATVNLRALRHQFGTVAQDAQLLQTSIMRNIALGRPATTAKEAWAAAEAAGVADDIRALPQQMETQISWDGSGVSGGQKQRILIARSLVGNPRVVFMDEATSALDNVAQARVSASLDALGCTRVVIAHRLSTIRNCDRILVLEGGKIVEDGTYEELMALNGRFALLVAKQCL